MFENQKKLSHHCRWSLFSNNVSYLELSTLFPSPRINIKDHRRDPKQVHRSLLVTQSVLEKAGQIAEWPLQTGVLKAGGLL